MYDSYNDLLEDGASDPLDLFHSENDRLYFNNRVIANFTLSVTNIYASPDPGEAPHRGKEIIELHLVFADLGKSMTVTMPSSDLESMETFKRITDCVCRDDRARPTYKELSMYIRLLRNLWLSDHEMGCYLDKTGWLSDSTYIAGSMLLGVPPEVPYLLGPDVSKQEPVCRLPENPVSVMKQTIRAVWENRVIFLPLFAYALMAPLRSVFIKYGLPPCGVLNLLGPYGRGKSRSAKTFFTHYNIGGAPAFFVEANSTKTSVFDALEQARGQVVVIDDIAKGSSKANERERIRLAGEVIRDVQNNSSRVKMSGRKRVEQFCNACAVLTGEIDPYSRSELSRCVTVRIRDQQQGGPSREDVAATVFSYIDWFGKHSEQEIRHLLEDYGHFQTADRSHKEERLRQSLWEMDWTMSSFLRFSREAGAITERAEASIRQELRSVLASIYQDTCQRLARAVPPADLLAVAIAQGARKRSFPCFTHRGCLCAKIKALTPYLGQVLRLPAESEQDIVKMLKEQGLLRMDKSGKATRKIGGVRYLTIPLGLLPFQSQ